MHDLIQMEMIETQGYLVKDLEGLMLFYSFMLLEVNE